MKAKIYITIDNSSPKLTEKNYGYVLECMINRSAITREGFGKTTGTYHQATLSVGKIREIMRDLHMHRG